MRSVSIGLLTLFIAAALCRPAAAKSDESAPRSAPVEVKTAFAPKSTTVAVMPVLQCGDPATCVIAEMDKACATARELIKSAFTDRGFRVVPDKEMPEKPRSLTLENGKDLAEATKADLVVDCFIKEYYSFDRRSLLRSRKAGVAIVHLLVYGAKDGYLVNDDFIARVTGGALLSDTTKRSPLREVALQNVIDTALAGLLKPYPVMKAAPSPAKPAVDGAPK